MLIRCNRQPYRCPPLDRCLVYKIENPNPAKVVIILSRTVIGMRPRMLEASTPNWSPVKAKIIFSTSRLLAFLL